MSELPKSQIERLGIVPDALAKEIASELGIEYNEAQELLTNSRRSRLSLRKLAEDWFKRGEKRSEER